MNCNPLVSCEIILVGNNQCFVYFLKTRTEKKILESAFHMSDICFVKLLFWLYIYIYLYTFTYVLGL